MFSTAIAVIFHNATSVHLYRVQLKCTRARGMSSRSSCFYRNKFMQSKGDKKIARELLLTLIVS